MKYLSLLSLLGLLTCVAAAPDDDPNLWLEDVTGPKALDWVRSQNAVTVRALAESAGFKALEARLLAILDSREKIPYVSKHGKYYYNFWQDEKNPCGLWRRTTLAEYKKAMPKWETVLDLDKLAANEKVNWIWKGGRILEPDYDRCLMSLSHGGADAATVREFDLNTKQFVKGGFIVPEAKSDVDWRNRNAIYISTDFGPGSQTISGYPREVKEWKRGTALAGATLEFEGATNDVGVSAAVDHDHGRVYEFMVRSKTAYASDWFLRRGHKWVQVPKQDDAELRTFAGRLLFTLRSDWTINGASYKAGSLLAANLDGWMKGDRRLEILFAPTERVSLQSVEDTRHYLILTVLDNVRSRVYLLEPSSAGWRRTPMATSPFGSVSVYGIDAEKSDDYFMTASDFLTPPTLTLGNAGSGRQEKLKSLPAFFNPEGLEAGQFEATSKDGTRVPYFVVGKQGMKLDGGNVTLLYGYGGFEISILPSYNAALGAAWLERGGVYVLANIRGGGEFGPAWHDAARQEHRQRAYDDFIAVAEDLIARKITSPAHLGIRGRSNGGLLMGVMLTERPDLFGAVDCGSPLLDMRRYTKLLAGASWIAEYGDPDRPEDWSYIQKYSPYQNVRPGKYPPILITSSTRDDRVHPGHARKMAQRLQQTGHEALFYENIEGGHGAAADNKQRAFMDALAFTFLWERLQ
ncbi:MAG TPA: prolyl oligopeptidase family serine peptidase [Candidatus Saccharimonadales bacterium]|nr:prolyl oligopeptidase family serine peptidase [Candidatus Saccharimonadales bacterium]